MNARFFEDVKRYVSFGEADARVLASLRPILAEAATPVVDTFYSRILEHPSARGAITGGPAQVERLKATLRGWFVELGDGVYDSAYLERRAAIGRRHVIIALPQVFMVTAMNVVRRETTAILRERLAADPARRDAALNALHKILDIDLAVMLETYQQDRLNRELEEARALVEEKRRLAALGEMVAGIAHEVRNPLQGVSWGLNELRALGRERPELAEAIGKIARGTSEIEAIVEQVLDFARPMKLETFEFPITDLIASTREDVAALAQERDVMLETDVARASPDAVVDPLKLKQALVNLARNAVEASPRGGRVVVRASGGRGRPLVFEVEDEGPGIPPELVERVYLPFVTTKVKGTGLGLGIARRIVEAHGGAISLTPRAPRGTLAKIVLA